MFRCETCGTGFNPTVAAATEFCPRCSAAGARSRLSFKLFEGRREEAGFGDPGSGASSEEGLGQPASAAGG